MIAKRLFDVLHGVDHHLLVLQGNTPTTRFTALALGAVELSTSYQVAIQVHTLGREHVELHQAYHVGEAVVVPVFFDGRNSRLFQLASHFHATLRVALLIKEFRARVGTSVGIAIGAPIPRAELAPFARDPKRMMDFLRERTYALSPKPLKSLGYGFEFEDKYRA